MSKSPLKWKRKPHNFKYWYDDPWFEIHLEKQLKQRKNKFKGGYYVVDRKTAMID